MSNHHLQAAVFHGDALRYVDVGEGPPVILVHGLLGSHASWGSQIDKLARDFRVIAVDLYGCGGSDKFKGDYSLSAHAASLRDLMQHLDIEKAAFVGHSYGGGVSMQMLYLFPERVERLCLVSSGGLGPEVSALLRAASLPGSELVLPIVASPVVRGLVGVVAAGMSLVGAPLRAPASVAEVWRSLGTVADPATRSAFLRITRGVLGPFGQTVCALKYFPDYKDLPAMVIWGRQDRMIPVHQAERHREVMPHAEAVVLDSAGHFPHLDEPEAFHEAIVPFLAAGANKGGLELQTG
ncbi:alpha/beta fold hydrolase [Hoyosella altamirensis]|uniref:Pimeloyl-ACP methyl ester carboxylesterase n=1 Tax=Hoyosella altamirensis TaxID=616997 RepID=A0A839RLB4_9ACTN|nr:alpha/beta fold hydrolase [Hoyosella altamirensis]MBB3036771.1 pimeloyl-ACP methyl ester carboxylesterase [Hoyosella altamirensis]